MSKPWQKLKRFIVDTHCHVGNYPEPQSIIDSLETEQMKALMMTVTPTEFLDFKERFQSAQITPCLGLFPLEFSRDDYRELEEQFFTELKTHKAIGEVGLDFTVEEKYQQRQVDFFSRLLGLLATEPAQFMSIHSRRASTKTIELIASHKRTTPAILHWFSGSIEDVKAACEVEKLYFSINPAMIKSRNCKEWLPLIPHDRILLESDGPYIQVGKRDIQPKDLTTVVEYFSKLWELPLEETMEIIHGNTERVINPQMHTD